MNHLGALPLAGAFGTLDFNGFAQASFVLPPGTSGALAGLALHHACAVLDAATLFVVDASPAAPIALVP